MLSEWSWNRKTTKGLITNLAIALILVLLANGVIFTVFPQNADSSSPGLLSPPGWLVGTVWVLLFAAMGVARWLVLDREKRPISNSTWVFLLLLFCLAYPAYTLGLKSLTIGLIGNIATIFAAGWVGLRIYRASRVAAGLISAVVAWLVFATFVTLSQIQRHGA